MSVAFPWRDVRLRSAKAPSGADRGRGKRDTRVSAAVGARNREWIDCLQSNIRVRVQ
jgi:hypothetical protein